MTESQMPSGASSVSEPTREQIAEAIASCIVNAWPTDPDVIRASYAVLALIQNGTK